MNMTIPTVSLVDEIKIALSRVHTPTIHSIINLTSECVIISEYNQLTDYHHYGNPTYMYYSTCIMGS